MEGARKIPLEFDTGTKKVIMGDGNDYEPFSLPPYAGVDASMVVATTNPVTGGSVFSGPNSTLQIPDGTTDYLSDIYLDSKAGRKLVVWGDSTADQNNAINSGYAYLGNAWVQKGLYAANNPLDVVNVGGNSGLRTDQIIPNFAAQVSAFTPDFVMLPVCTNDLIQGYGNDYAINGLMTMVGLVESIGAVPILCCLTPGDTWASNATNRLLWKTHNSSVRTIGALMGFPVWDGSKAFATTPGEPDAIPGTNDGIHSNNLGCEYLARSLSVFFRKVARRRLGTILTAGNICTNPLLAGTGGSKQAGVTGIVPDGCTAATVAGSISSVYGRTDGGPGNWWQQILTLNAGTGSVWYFGATTMAAAGIAVGDAVRAVVDVELLDGHSGINSISLVLSYTGGTPNGATSNNDATNNGVAIAPGKTKRQLATPKKPIPAGTTALSMYLVVSTNTLAGSGVVRVGAPSISKVS